MKLGSIHVHVITVFVKPPQEALDMVEELVATDSVESVVALYLLDSILGGLNSINPANREAFIQV